AVSVKVRVPVTLAMREVVPVTSPIPLLRLNPVAPVTLQCRVTVPLVGNVVGLALNERICGGTSASSQARKNRDELAWGVNRKFDCPGALRNCGVQSAELNRLLRC